MKITPDHYARIVEAIRPLKPLFQEHREALRTDPRVKDLEKRFRWDVAHAAKLTPFFCECVYQYAHDEHIDTALREAIEEIGVE